MSRPLPPPLRLAALATLVACAACAADERAAGPVPADAPSAAKRTTVPGAPRGVQATAGDARAMVAWTAPKSDGGSAILRYVVTATPGGATATVNAPALSATVTGLANGTAYTFVVAAVNAVGTGPASAPSNAVTPSAPVPPPPAGARWVSGYYVGYQRGLYPPASVDFSQMTHVIVGRIIPGSDGSVITHFDIDAVNGPAMARDMSTRAHAAGRKAILMLGGAGEHAGFVGAASSANRARFVANLLRTMDDLGYDGIDVDWEPINAEDRAPLLALLQELRAARPGMLLTIPVGWVNTNFVQVDAWYAQVASVVNQMNVMTYDMAGPWGGWVSWHFSALLDHQASHPSSIAGSVAQYRAAGVPAAKLGVGIGFYGSCWRGVTGPRQAITSGVSLVASDNVMSYTNIMTQYYQSAARRWDDVAKATYLAYASPVGPQGCQFIGYEDEQSIAAKGSYVRANGLGGAIIWTIAQGHLPNAPLGARDPLLSAAYTAIVP